MPNDLLLDPLTGDLQIIGLDLAIVQGADRVRQNIQVKLKLWQNEWFLDTEFGTPYIEQILGKRISLNGAIAALKTAILEVSEVDAISAFKYNFSRQTRLLTVNFTAHTPFGLIEVKQ